MKEIEGDRFNNNEISLANESTEITEMDMGILDGVSSRTLCYWWCTLNVWDWPEDLPNPEDPNAFLSVGLVNTRRDKLMREITKRVTEKQVLREWNCNFIRIFGKPNMTNTEFEEWWISRKTV